LKKDYPGLNVGVVYQEANKYSTASKRDQIKAKSMSL